MAQAKMAWTILADYLAKYEIKLDNFDIKLKLQVPSIEWYINHLGK